MRATPATLDDGAFRRAVERLDALPIRPAVARQVFAVLVDDVDPRSPSGGISPAITIPLTTETDPAWALARSRIESPRSFDPADVLIESRWWVLTSPTATDAITALWRHSAAVALAARRIARDANDPDPDRVARAGLLHHLGLWAIAAVDPIRLLDWVKADPAGRWGLEKRWFGAQVSAIGRRLAEQWACDPLVTDAAWLHADADGALNDCASDPARLAMVQQAYAQARRTPWSLDPHPGREFGPTDASVRILTAEVQSRCGSPLIDPDASSREERLTRDNLRLRRDLAQAISTGGSATRLMNCLATASPVADPQTWADRAALAWCHEPGVASARVVWRSSPLHADQTDEHPPSLIVPIGDPAQPMADLLLWDQPAAGPFTPSPAVLAGWNGWARLVADREQVVRSRDQIIASHRRRVDRDEADERRTTLASLAEFAAGAGHELNNPLAVIMGRAQLVLVRTADPETTRSLRAIIAQAQRAHRILRDLMYVARPSDSRPRACQPDEIVRASLRDLQHEAEAQGIRLVLDTRDSAPALWADPDPLRQVADILTRNAIEASTTGATVRFTTGGDARQVRWTVHDAGRGIAPDEGVHLFDPFFCGRQAGRGLGLGLPRAARIIDQVGGDLRWQSSPGQGATFQVTWPIHEIPTPLETGRVEAASPVSAALG